jgi:hypothetical protein
MKNYIYAILLFYLVTELDLYTNSTFIILTITYFVCLFVFRFIKFSLENAKNRDIKQKNIDLVTQLSYGKDEIPEPINHELPDIKKTRDDFNKMLADKAAEKAQRKLDLIKSKLNK